MRKGATYIPASGIKTSAKYTIVGEQPGMMEIREGKPFVGPSGRLLDECLQSVKLLRSEAYITNVFKDLDRPLKYYLNSTKKGPIVSPDGQKYFDELKNELVDGPQIILAFGNVALYALTSRWGISKWRGSILPSTLVEGKVVIPTFHPATVLPPKCQFLNRYLILNDLKRAKDYLDGNIKEHKFECAISPSFDDAKAYLKFCIKKGLEGSFIAFDIEISNYEMIDFSLSHNSHYALSIPLKNGQGDYFTVGQETIIIELLADLLENPQIKILGQNLSFDAHFMLRKYGIHTRNIYDTMVAQQILYTDFPKGLDFITSMWTTHPYYKAEGKEWFRSGGKFENLWTYNATDSLICSWAWPQQKKALEESENYETYRRQSLIIPPLVYMQERGIKLNVKGMSKAYEEMMAEFDLLQKKLNEVAGRELNPNSPKQLKEYFYDHLKIKAYRSNGKATTNSDALKRLARRGYEEARIIMEMRKLKKLASTYLDDVKFDEDGRIRTSFNPVGTRFSRVSSSKNIFGTGGNLQNIPHSILKYYLPDDGYLYYSFDLSQAENRIVAYVGNVIKMIQAFESGADVHSLTAGLIFGKPPEEISNEPGSCSIGDGTKSERFYGKKANHGLNYDLGYKNFSFQLEIPEHAGRFIVERYHAVYPGVRNTFHATVRQMLQKDRTITNLMGRKTKFLGEWGNNLFKDAYSCIPQGTVGDIMNERGLNYIYYNQDLFGPVELLIQVHDSIGFQIPLSIPWLEHAKILRLIKTSLETPLTWKGHTFTIPADLTIGLNMGKDGKELKGNFIQSEEEFSYKLKQIYEELKDNAAN